MNTDDPRTRERRVLAILTTIVFMAVASGTMVNVALPILGRDLGVSEGTYGWVVTGYTLTFAVFSAIHGRMADNIGLRRLYLAGVTGFGTVALAVAVMPSILPIIGLRLVQGAAAAAMPSLGTVIVSRIFPVERRGTALGLILGVVGLGASIGPLLGGALVQWFSWRAAFAFPALALLAVPLGLRWLPASLDEGEGQPFDAVGAALLGLGVGALMTTPDLLQRFGPGWQLGVAAATGVGLLGAFWAWIGRREHPFAPRALLTHGVWLKAALVAFFAQATRFGTVVLIPILLVEVEHLEPIWVGLVLLPGALLITLVSPLAGRWSDRVGARLPVSVGIGCMVAGNLVSIVATGASVLGVCAGMTLYGLGFAFVQSPLVSAVSSTMPERLTGVALGMFMMTFFLGGSFGVAMSVTAVELQTSSVSWIGLQDRGAPYGNAMLTLTGLIVLAWILVQGLPRTAARTP